MDEETIEKIARRYCQLLGFDPDEMVSHGADPDELGFVPAVLLYSPRWKRLAGKVKAHLAMHQAIGECE